MMRSLPKERSDVSTNNTSVATGMPMAVAIN